MISFSRGRFCRILASFQTRRDLTSLPLLERKKLLSKTVKQNDRLAISSFVEGQGAGLFGLTQQQGLEGVVGKKKDSLYYPGKRTKDWVKVKNLLDDDFVVCGYIVKSESIVSIVLGQYGPGGEMEYKGHVTMGVSRGDFARIQALPPAGCPFDPLPKGNDKAVWVAPELACTVKYMEKTANGGLRQPVFKGLREDKTASECVDRG